MEVRAARPDDGSRLLAVERLAGERFSDVGLDAVAEDDPPPLDAIARYAEAGRSWVAVDDAGEPFGYVLVNVVDGDAHVEQLTVHPEQQGRGAGRALLAAVRSWALEHGRSAVTLTTFATVPWNRPLFEHLGFEVLGPDEIAPGLQSVRNAETARGLDPRTRVCMRWNLTV